MPSTIPPSPGPNYTWNGTAWVPATGGTNVGQSVQTTAQTAQIVPVQPHNRVIYSVGNNDGIGNNE